MVNQTLDLPLTNCCYSQKLLSGHAIELKIEKDQQDLDFKFQNKNKKKLSQTGFACMNSSLFFFPQG